MEPIPIEDRAERTDPVPTPTWGIGEVLSGSIAAYKNNLAPFTIVGLAAVIPQTIWTSLIYNETNPTAMGMYILGSTGIGLVLGSLATAVLVYGVYQELRGQRVGLGPCLSVGMANLPLVIGVSLLYGLAVVGGLLALIVPGVIAALGLFVAVPVAIIEKLPTMESLKRSLALTRGYRGRIFGVMLILGLVNGGIHYVLTQIIASSPSDQALAAWISTPVTVVFTVLNSCATALVYYHIRAEVEGLDADQLAAVFD